MLPQLLCHTRVNRLFGTDNRLLGCRYTKDTNELHIYATTVRCNKLPIVISLVPHTIGFNISHSIFDKLGHQARFTDACHYIIKRNTKQCRFFCFLANIRALGAKCCIIALVLKRKHTRKQGVRQHKQLLQ
jgi:hypothetical protein